MTDRCAFFTTCGIAATAVCLALSACSSAESQARDAYADYQTASAAGDLHAARGALQRLVAANEGVAGYWEELAKVQVALGDNPGAYYAFTRAYELDRDNAQVLSSLTQLALIAGDIDAAQRHAEELELLSPSDPAVKLAYGYIALRRRSYDEADRLVDAILANSPFDPRARLLKARIHAARGELGKAVDILEDQLRTNPKDVGVLRGLAALHERMENWRDAALVSERLWRLKPEDPEFALTAVDAALRAEDVTTARRLSESLLRPDASPRLVGQVLEIWAQRWTSPQAIAEAERLARLAPATHRLAYATYFNDAGRPDRAAALVGHTPRLPLQGWNLSTNAVIAGTLAGTGRMAEARKLLDEILRREPDHVYALRTRINLAIRTGDAKTAVTGAQRLVSIVPTSVPDRLLLASAYAAAGETRQVERTLWDAFHEIPANLELYEALRAHVLKARGADAAHAVDREYSEQRDVSVARQFI